MKLAIFCIKTLQRASFFSLFIQLTFLIIKHTVIKQFMNKKRFLLK